MNAWNALGTLFDGAPNFSDMVKKLNAVKFKSDDTSPGKDKMVMTNDERYGAWGIGDLIIGEDSDAVGTISEITKTKVQKRFRDKVNKVYGGAPDFVLLSQTIESVDMNPNGTWKEVTTKFKRFGDINFIAGEKVFEAKAVPDKESQRNLFAGKTGPDYPITYNYIKKPLKGSALNDNILASNVVIGDVPKYGEILGIDVSAPPSISPNFDSIKIKDMIPGYAGFFDEIIGFAEGLKSGVYWLTIKTYGGNKAIQAALTGSDDPPPDSLKFTAGFLMVSVSGMQGLSSTKGLELLFGQNGLGLEFQEVAPIPEVSELDTAVLALQTNYQAATAAQAELATDVFDVLGLNPPVTFRDATQIKFTDWNGVEPNVGDYVLGTKSGAFGQILAFSAGGTILVLDHIKIGPTIAGSKVDEERIVRMLDVASDTYIEFPYDGSVPTTSALAFDANPALAIPLVGEGRFTEEVLVNRSSHKPNGTGTTVYEVFQGNEGTFVGVDDVEELVSESEFILFASQPFNTFSQDRTMKQQVFKVVNGAVKDPELESGYNGIYGHFTGDDSIISFSEEQAQTFLTDIEGRNTAEDNTRLNPPPTLDSVYPDKMSVVIAGTDSVTITGAGGIVESYAVALDNKENPNNLPETT